MIATFQGETTDRFSNGKDYTVFGFADSVVVLLDDNNLLACLSYAALNSPKQWSLKA